MPAEALRFSVEIKKGTFVDMGCLKLDISEQSFTSLKVVHNDLNFNGNSCAGAYLFGFNGMEKEVGLYDDESAYNFGARIYDSRIGRWMSTDPLQSKYPSLSPYNFSVNSPLAFKDPDGKDVLLVIWGTGDGNHGVGHAAIAVSNYKEQEYKVMENGVEITKTRMVADGTYTVRDLWPGTGAGKKNFAKDIKAAFSPMSRDKSFTLDQILNSDITDGAEGRAADGVIKFTTDYSVDQSVNTTLDDFEKSKDFYNGVTNNCSDYAEEAINTIAVTPIDGDEVVSDQISVTSPNQVYKSTAKLKGAEILKDGSSSTVGRSIDAVVGDNMGKAVSKVEKQQR